MPGLRRVMRLTPDVVAMVPPFSGDSGLLATRSDRPTDDDYQTATANLLATAPADGNIWIFAYGSLIWNPEFEFVEERLGTLAGWHRSFCLGWVRIYRGTPENPGIMLALDRGGSCRGAVFRLPRETAAENLGRILRREMPIKRPNLPTRWVSVRTTHGDLRAIAFPISRKSAAYLPGLTEETVVDALAKASGERGSMAEYLYSTVKHLEERGIHDRYLWRLQELVADKILAIVAAGQP